MSSYYEDGYGRRGRREKKRRKHGCLSALGRSLLKLLALLLILVLLTMGILYVIPTELFMVEPEEDVSLTDGLPGSPFHVLVLGVDTESEGLQRSDTMMIVSVDRKNICLSSVQRDTLVELEGRGDTKINAAYAYGGPYGSMRAVNRLLDSNIVGYVVVDFTLLVRLVDALGGLEMDISEQEMRHINRNVLLSRSVFQPLGYEGKELKTYGDGTRLDGLQTLGYARIRKLDSDFMRTSRQRRVIMALIKKIRSRLYDPVLMARLLRICLEGIQTNLSWPKLVSLAEKALLADGVRELRLPVNDSFTDNGSALTITDREANVRAFREFVYGFE